MEHIIVTVRGTDAIAHSAYPLTAGSVGVTVSIVFNQMWDELTKRVYFASGGTIKSIPLLPYTDIIVPWECMVEGQTLRIGVDGISDDGATRIPTVWATVGVVKKSVSGVAADNPDTEPTPTVVDQIQSAASSARIEAKEALDTVNTVVSESLKTRELAEKAAHDASKSAESALESEKNAQKYADLSEQNAEANGFFFVEDGTDGHLYFVKSDNVDDFTLENENGRLIAIYG